jgi:hypothetical protein
MRWYLHMACPTAVSREPLCERGIEVDQVTIPPVGTDLQLPRPVRLATGVGRQRYRDSPLQDHRHHPSGNADGNGLADLPLRISRAAPGYTVAVDVWPLRLAVRAGFPRPVSCHSERSRRSVLSSCLVVTRHRMHALVGPVP